MKRVVCMVCALLFLGLVQAQSTTIKIAIDKTVSLVFPFPIVHVDRGTKEVLVQAVKDANNILLVKAASASIKETNLSVVTADGNVHSFLVCYGAPSTLVYQVPVVKKVAAAAYAAAILDNGSRIHGVGAQKWGISMHVAGIYIKEDMLFFHLHFSNRSAIDYDFEYLRFYIKDRNRGRKTTAQEVEVKPSHIAGNDKAVSAHSKASLVLVVPKFTIPDAKFFMIELGEKNGGRQLHIKVDNRHLVRALILPDMR